MWRSDNSASAQRFFRLADVPCFSMEGQVSGGTRVDSLTLASIRIPRNRLFDTLARSDPEVQTRCPDELFPGSISLGVEPGGSTPDRKRSDSTGHPGRLHHQNYPGSDKPPSRCKCDPSQNCDGIPSVLAEDTR